MSKSNASEIPNVCWLRSGKQTLERQKVLALAQAREIDAVLVTKLTRWGRSP